MNHVSLPVRRDMDHIPLTLRDPGSGLTYSPDSGSGPGWPAISLSSILVGYALAQFFSHFRRSGTSESEL